MLNGLFACWLFRFEAAQLFEHSAITHTFQGSLISRPTWRALFVLYPRERGAGRNALSYFKCHLILPTKNTRTTTTTLLICSYLTKLSGVFSCRRIDNTRNHAPQPTHATRVRLCGCLGRIWCYAAASPLFWFERAYITSIRADDAYAFATHTSPSLYLEHTGRPDKRHRSCAMSLNASRSYALISQRPSTLATRIYLRIA